MKCQRIVSQNYIGNVSRATIIETQALTHATRGIEDARTGDEV